ncbi:hypothetical protein GCM10010517_13550 [Streptosporangium fragile]|uniref:Transposase IS701-like DDE domain-containing protein n=1 Tax=Streptosporangium fragile TaxID=46186 RepID=A0ABN3VS74_9ACTN
MAEEWDDDAERRAGTGMPDEVRHREKWRPAVDLIGEAIGRGLAPQARDGPERAARWW